MNWTIINGKECGQLGGLTAFRILYNGVDGSKKGKQYMLVCNLPGIRIVDPYSDSIEALKGLASRTCERWLSYCNLQSKGSK